jgi:hypothetical protein
MKEVKFKVEKRPHDGPIVHFTQVYAKLRHGEDIRLVGNIPSLGCDNLNRAIVLVTTPQDFPWWWNKDGK